MIDKKNEPDQLENVFVRRKVEKAYPRIVLFYFVLKGILSFSWAVLMSI